MKNNQLKSLNANGQIDSSINDEFKHLPLGTLVPAQISLSELLEMREFLKVRLEQLQDANEAIIDDQTQAEFSMLQQVLKWLDLQEGASDV